MSKPRHVLNVRYANLHQLIVPEWILSSILMYSTFSSYCLKSQLAFQVLGSVGGQAGQHIVLQQQVEIFEEKIPSGIRLKFIHIKSTSSRQQQARASLRLSKQLTDRLLFISRFKLKTKDSLNRQVNIIFLLDPNDAQLPVSDNVKLFWMLTRLKIAMLGFANQWEDLIPGAHPASQPEPGQPDDSDSWGKPEWSECHHDGPKQVISKHTNFDLKGKALTDTI